MTIDSLFTNLSIYGSIFQGITSDWAIIHASRLSIVTVLILLNHQMLLRQLITLFLILACLMLVLCLTLRRAWGGF